MKRRAIFIWTLAYAAVITSIAFGMLFVRDRTLATLGTPQALAEWQQWREEASKLSAQGPVQRRIPQSSEPPALMLMRDYFPIMLIGGLFFGSVLFALFGWALHGAFLRRSSRRISNSSV